MATVTCCVIGIAMPLPTSVEGPAQSAFDAYNGVDTVAGSMTTGIFLIGIGVCSLLAGPFSVTFGRDVIYFSALFLPCSSSWPKLSRPTTAPPSPFAFYVLCLQLLR